MLFLGAYGGIFVFAFMSMSAKECEQAVKDEEAVERDGFGLVDPEKEWSA
jgi:hypothetical protein